jgi:propanol-preferring alcohol dehydrogenase
MRAAVLREFGTPLAVEQRDCPVPGPGEILIRVEACGVCHSDLHVADADWPSLRKHTRLPVIPGHEAVGVVAEIGQEVSGWAPGDRVGVPWLYWTCGECEYCLDECEPLCSRQQITGVMVDGGFAEYMVAKASHPIAIPPGLPAAEAAPLFCAGLTAFRALRKCGVRPGQTVAIYGAGGLGHLAIQIAKKQGTEVIAVDVSEEKLELARECGTDATVHLPDQKPPRVHAALVCSASVSAYQGALGGLRKGGVLAVVGMPAEPIPLQAFSLVSGELRLVASAVGTRAELRELLDLAAAGAIRCRTEAFPLSEVAEVFQRLRQGAVRGRAVLLPGG